MEVDNDENVGASGFTGPKMAVKEPETVNREQRSS